MFPINKVRMVITNRDGIQKSANGAKQKANNLKKAEKPAVFTTVDMKAVIKVGEPS